jgi:hypothetical protein
MHVKPPPPFSVNQVLPRKLDYALEPYTPWTPYRLSVNSIKKS